MMIGPDSDKPSAKPAPKSASNSVAFPKLFVVPLTALLIHQLPGLPPVWLAPVLALLVLGLRIAIGFWLTRQHTRWHRSWHWCQLGNGLLLALVCASYVVWRADVALTDRLPRGLEGQDLMVQGRVAGLVRPFEYGQGFNFVIEACAQKLSWCQGEKLVRLSWYGKAGRQAVLLPGERWRLTVRLKRSHGPVNPGGFDSELRALQTGTTARGYVRGNTKKRQLAKPNQHLDGGSPGVLDKIDRARIQVVSQMGSALANWPEPVRGTLVALVTGEQSAIPSASWLDYNRTGTSHLMSISGLHVTLFAALVMFVCRWLLRVPALVPPWFLLRVSAPALIVCLGVLAALGYSLFSGWGIPAQRTTLMLAVAGFAVHSGRVSGIAPVLAVASAIVVMLDPWAPLAAGFWLSFVAVGAIVLTAQGVRTRVERSWWQAARTQWAATVSLIPLSAVWFGTFSLVSPLANAIAIPLISALVTPMALFAAALQYPMPSLGGFLLQVIAWPTQWLLTGLAWLSQMPAAILVVGQPPLWVLALGGLGCWVLLAPSRPAPRWFGFLFLLPQLIMPIDAVPSGGWRLLALDVGQGNSVLVQTASHALLFDTGPSYRGLSGAGDRIVAPALQARQLSRLDTLLISHKDLDHAGGSTTLLKTFEVDHLLTSMAPEHPISQLAENYQPCLSGQRWHWDGVSFEILHPGVSDKRAAKPNARSCVLKISGPGGSALLTGDIEAAQERRIVNLYGPERLHVDVLLAPHHGSNTSSTAAFLDAVKPNWAIFQIGYRNRFRHPTEKVLKRYRERGITALRSDRDGALEWRFRQGAKPTLIRYRQQRPKYWRIDVP